MRKENRDNETRIVDTQKLNRSKNKDTDITEIVLLSGYAGLVVMWVVACCS